MKLLYPLVRVFDTDAAAIVARMLEFDAKYRPRAEERQMFGPLDDRDARLGQDVFEGD
jgi:hypothetical protein